MENAYKFRLYPTDEQKEQITKTFGCVRFVYNALIDLRKSMYTLDGNFVPYAACAGVIADMKKDEDYAWLKDADATALQNAARDLDRAYANFFAGRARFPRFKSKRDSRQSYRATNNTSTYTNKAGGETTSRTIDVRGNMAKLPKLGWVKCAVSRKIRGRILSATITKSASGRYFVSFCVADETFAPMPVHTEARAVGIDLGIKSLATLSDGTVVPNHRYLDQHLHRIAHLQKILSRKQKGSGKYERVRRKIAAEREKVTNARSDECHKLTHGLVHDFDIICIEDLNVRGMVRNHNLARAISDVRWGEIRRQLSYKCDRYGRELVVVGRFYASSQICSACGGKNPAVKDLSVREWDCPHCGTRHDRDVNAARNILKEGLRILAQG